MGYYTRIKNIGFDGENEKYDVSGTKDEYLMECILNDDDQESESGKNYHFESDMKIVSKRYPEVVFIFEEESCESDGWSCRWYFKDGVSIMKNVIKTYEKLTDEEKQFLKGKMKEVV